MKWSHSKFVPQYLAPLLMFGSREPMGTWYGEYDGTFTVREFVIRSDNRVMVSSFDLPFRAPGHPTEPPAIEGVAPISLREFEQLWEQFAQPRLHMLAAAGMNPAGDLSIRYFHSPFPAEFKIAEAASDIYTEFAAGVARRSFEVFTARTLVAPYDGGIPEIGTDEMVRAANEELDIGGVSLERGLRPEEIHHAQFEELWEEYALPRLRELAEL